MQIFKPKKVKKTEGAPRALIVSRVFSAFKSGIKKLFKRRKKTFSKKTLRSKAPLIAIETATTKLEKSPNNDPNQPFLELDSQEASFQRKNHRAKALSIKPQMALEEFSGVQLSPHTQKAYKRDLHDFFAYLTVQGRLESWNQDLSPIDIAQYRSYLVEQKKLAKPSVTRKLAVLKSFFKWAMAREWVQFNPAELVRGFPQTQESKTGFLVDSEIDKLLTYLDFLPAERLFNGLAKTTLQTLLMLGIRRAEASRIRLGDLTFQEDKWLLRIKGKGDRERLLPLPERLIESWEHWLRRIGEEAPREPYSMFGSVGMWLDYFYRNADLPLLISTRAKNFSTPLCEAEIAHIVRKFGRKAGIPQRLSPHMLRATAITHALDQGASDRSVQQMAGWTSPLMITRYDKRRRDPRYSAVYHLKFAKKIYKDVLEK